MLEGYTDILTVNEACEALRVGYNALICAAKQWCVESLSKWSHVEDSQVSCGRVYLKKCADESLILVPPEDFWGDILCFLRRGIH